MSTADGPLFDSPDDRRRAFVDALARSFAEGSAHLGYGGEITESIRDLVVAADRLVEVLDDNAE